MYINNLQDSAQEAEVLGVDKTLYKYSTINSSPNIYEENFVLFLKLIVPRETSILDHSQSFLQHPVANRIYHDIDMITS